MSARLIMALALAGLIGFGAGASWMKWQSSSAQVTSGNVTTPSSDEAQRVHREKFFSGDSERDVRSGQEMKPRW
ncbi:entry exclusion protein TrbK [Rhizobium lusitanum]|uniref:Ti type entry exclusion protein TrbK n=1 Tax=Rhizobium lusitanum TaxID=293958 RepID=A0A7X0IXD0_9HYPH|nr:entry exclusion protein TrbK [Rhizobium lusitanum]MBB6488884.1 Ti type entry exclusion protein TrbK [Rhizobium lusitanum]